MGMLSGNAGMYHDILDMRMQMLRVTTSHVTYRNTETYAVLRFPPFPPLISTQDSLLNFYR